MLFDDLFVLLFMCMLKRSIGARPRSIGAAFGAAFGNSILWPQHRARDVALHQQMRVDGETLAAMHAPRGCRAKQRRRYVSLA